jgi:hypothetical protein
MEVGIMFVSPVGGLVAFSAGRIIGAAANIQFFPAANRMDRRGFSKYLKIVTGIFQGMEKDAGRKAGMNHPEVSRQGAKKRASRLCAFA